MVDEDRYVAPETFTEFYDQYGRMVRAMVADAGFPDVSDVTHKILIKLLETYRRCVPCQRRWVVGRADAFGVGPGCFNHRVGKRWPEDRCPLCGAKLGPAVTILREYDGKHKFVSADGRKVGRTSFSGYVGATVVRLIKNEQSTRQITRVQRGKVRVMLHRIPMSLDDPVNANVLASLETPDLGLELRVQFREVYRILQDRDPAEMAKLLGEMLDALEEGTVLSLREAGQRAGLSGVEGKRVAEKLRMELRQFGMAPSVLST